MATHTRTTEAEARQCRIAKVRGRAQYGVQCSHCGDLLATLPTLDAAKRLRANHNLWHWERDKGNAVGQVAVIPAAWTR